MSTLTKEQVLPVRRYIASFALPPSYSSDGFPMRARLDADGNLANSAPLTDARITEAQISNAAQNSQRGALNSVSEAKLAEARAGEAGKATKLKGLAPSQVDLVDRKFRGRQESLGLSEPDISPLYQGYINQPGNPSTQRKRQSVSGKRANALTREGKSLTVDSLLDTSAGRQATATRSNAGYVDPKATTKVTPRSVPGLSAVDVAARRSRQQALIASKDLDEFYSKLNSGVPVTPDEQARGRAALQTLLDQKRTVKANAATAGGTSVTPLEDLLSSSRKIDYLTANATPVSVPLTEPAQQRLIDRGIGNGNAPVPSYIAKDAAGNLDTTQAVYIPKVRAPGQQSAIARRAGRLDRAQSMLTNAERALADGGAVDDSLLYSIAGKPSTVASGIADPWGPPVIPTPVASPTVAPTPTVSAAPITSAPSKPIPRMSPPIPAPPTPSAPPAPGLGVRMQNAYNNAATSAQNYVQGVQNRWAQIPPISTPVTATPSASPVPSTAPPQVVVPPTPPTVPVSQNIKGTVTVPSGGQYSAEVEVPPWLRGKSSRTPAVKKPQPLQINATRSNIPGDLLDTVRSRVGSLSPDNKNLALAGLLGVGGVGMLAGGSLLGRSRQSAQAAREQELNDIARRPPDEYAGYGAPSPYLNQQYPGY